MKKYHIEKNSIQETLVIPLYGRKVCREQSWKQVLQKRTILSIIWIFLAAVVAGCVMLTGGIK